MGNASTKKRTLNVEPQVPGTQQLQKSPTMANTPSASTIMDGMGSGIGSPGMLKQVHSVAAFSAVDQLHTDPNIKNYMVTNAIKHEIFLKDEQKDFKKIMNRGAFERRQQEIVYDQGRDQVEEMESDLAQQKARYEQSINAKNEALRKKKLKKLL